MKLLAIDCSTERAQVALSFQGGITSLSKEGVREHAKCLLPMVEQLLNEASLTLSNLDGLVLGRGPGSFTGLRVACSIIKGLSLAHDLPVYPVSGLDAMIDAVQVESQSRLPVLAVIDARMQELYWSWSLNREEQLSSAALITIPLTEPFILAGVGLDLYREAFHPALLAKIAFEKPIYPEATAMLRLALSGQIKAVDAETVLPVYIRNQIIQGNPNG